MANNVVIREAATLEQTLNKNLSMLSSTSSVNNDTNTNNSEATRAETLLLRIPIQKQQQEQTMSLPDHFTKVDLQSLTHLIADVLTRLVLHNDQIPLSSSNLTRFHSRAPPGISITEYLRRIVKYASVERICLLILLIYIDRVCEKHRKFMISSLTVHRFVVTACTIASKALCDSYLTNSMYAKVGGLSTRELNLLEIEMCFLIGWNLAATAELMQQYYVRLIRQHPSYNRVSIPLSLSMMDKTPSPSTPTPLTASPPIPQSAALTLHTSTPSSTSSSSPFSSSTAMDASPPSHVSNSISSNSSHCVNPGEVILKSPLEVE